MAKSNILLRSKLKKVKQLLDEKKFEEADKILAQLVLKAPREAETWLYKGYIEGFKDNHIKAAEYFKKALDIKPDDSSILYNYGIALRDSGDYKSAIDAFNKSLLKNAENTQTLDCLAHAYMALKDLDKAVDVFHRSLTINPKQPETHSNLGSVYQAQGELNKAEACYREALRLDPGLKIFDNIGSVLVSQGRYEESIDMYRTGLSRQPKNARVFSNLLLTLNYMDSIGQNEMFDEHCKYGDTFLETKDNTDHNTHEHINERIRIGYYSPDFREHSVAYFIEPVIECHDKNNFETYAYYPSKNADAVTERLSRSFDVWRDVSGKAEDEIAGLIESDKIDIMVDLAGHTSNNCLLVFAKRPAPVQITYLGYPNTTGLKAIQYRITDSIADPAGQDEFYSEELCRLPGCFLTYKPDIDSPEVSAPPVTKNGYVTFGSFNNLSKINDHVIDVWCSILKEVPDSRILIKNPSLTDINTRQVYHEKFSQRDIGTDRVELTGHTPTRYEHLSLYGNVDVALDTFPYNGTTTTCEALWMGVPVIVLCGKHHAARVGASLLEAVNRKEWIANSEDEYVELAARLAGDTESLRSARELQREQISHSPLLDARTFVESLEKEYRRIWDNYNKNEV